MNKELCNRILSCVDTIPWVTFDFTSPSGIRFHNDHYWIRPNSEHPPKEIRDEILAFVEDNIPQYEGRILPSTKISKYLPGDFAERHRDAMKYRRYTLLVQLSDPSSYEGGDLIIDDQVVSREQGAQFLFDSQVNWHSVSPIRSGIRYSLVHWAYEEPLDKPAD